MAREDVGQVDVKEHYAFVAVRRSKMKQLLTLVRGEKNQGNENCYRGSKVIYLINIHFICAYSFEYEVMKPPCF